MTYLDWPIREVPETEISVSVPVLEWFLADVIELSSLDSITKAAEAMMTTIAAAIDAIIAIWVRDNLLFMAAVR